MTELLRTVEYKCADAQFPQRLCCLRNLAPNEDNQQYHNFGRWRNECNGFIDISISQQELREMVNDENRDRYRDLHV